MTDPTPNLGFNNFFRTTLTSGITATDTVIPLLSVPTVTEGFLVIDPDGSNPEVIHYTSKSSSTVTVPSTGDRGTGGTSARIWASGTVVRMDAVAGMFEALQNGKSLYSGSIGTTAFADGWTPTLDTWAYASNDGNKQFTITTFGDQTTKYTPGHKIKVARGTTPPTQALSFTVAGTSTATKTTPTGISFTTTFTFEAWVYLPNYTAASEMLLSRTSGTNGWQVYINSTGQVVCEIQPSAGTTRVVTSYQSVPLGRWTHVAVTFSSGTVAAYFNGATISTSTTGAATTITQAGDLFMGKNGSGNFYPDARLSEVRLWSVAQSQATIQSNMTISLTGSETNLVGLWQGNGTFADKTTNANNLTAAGSAIATYADNPYNATEYGIITKAAYSAPNTTLTIFTGTSYTIPNQTLSTSYYSDRRVPFGFPASADKWEVRFVLRTNATQAAPTNDVWYNLGSSQLLVPIGAWDLGYHASLLVDRGAGGSVNVKSTLSTGSSTEADIDYSGAAFTAATSTQLGAPVTRRKALSLTAATTYYLNACSNATVANIYLLNGAENGNTIISAISAYL